MSLVTSGEVAWHLAGEMLPGAAAATPAGPQEIKQCPFT